MRTGALDLSSGRAPSYQTDHVRDVLALDAARDVACDACRMTNAATAL